MRLTVLSEADPSRRGFFSRFLPKRAEEPDDKLTPGGGLDQSTAETTPTDDPDRRDFLRTTGGAVSAVAQASPLGRLASNVLGTAKLAAHIPSAWDAMSDKELLETPEGEWLGQIDPKRAAQIAKDNPEHGPAEAVAKLSRILSYGFMKQAGIHPSISEPASRRIGDMTKRFMKAGFDPERSKSWATARIEAANKSSDALMQISKHWNLKADDVMSKAAEFGSFQMPGQAREFLKFMKLNADNYNIDMSGATAQKAEQVTQRVERHLNAAEPERQRFRKEMTQRRDEFVDWHKAKRDENRRALAGDDELGRWDWEGGATFEAKLTRALRCL